MQSEFACHVGLAGKFFCRACWVKGSDALADALLEEASRSHQTRQESPAASDDGSALGVDGASDDAAKGAEESGSAAGQKSKGRRKRVLETMSSMVTRLKAFVNVSPVPSNLDYLG